MRTIEISGIMPHQARTALVEAHEHGVLSTVKFHRDGDVNYVTVVFAGQSEPETFAVDHPDAGCATYMMCIDGTEDTTAFRVAEGIIRLAAHAIRKGGVK